MVEYIDNKGCFSAEFAGCTKGVHPIYPNHLPAPVPPTFSLGQYHFFSLASKTKHYYSYFPYLCSSKVYTVAKHQRRFLSMESRIRRSFTFPFIGLFYSLFATIFFFFFVVIPTAAQSLHESAILSEVPSEADLDRLEQWQYYLAHPIDLNTASLTLLRTLPFFARG